MSRRLNLLAPDVRSNPYPHYAELRRNAPVCQVEPGGMWAITRYEDVLFAYKNPHLFSSDLSGGAARHWTENNPLADSLLLMDPPRHGRLRALVTRAFGPQTLTRVQPRIRAVVEELVDGLLRKRTVDFVEDFALPVPASIIALLLGLDLSLSQHFKRWADTLLSAPGLAEEDVKARARVRATVEELEKYLREVLEERRRQPGEDLVSDLLRARVDGEALTDKELMGFLVLLLVAGLETTMHLLSHSGLLLAEQPEVLARVREEPARIPAFLEELLRYEPPVHGSPRLVMEDVELGGVKLARGTPVLVMIGSANRDEAYVPDGERFSLEREGPHHLPFGHGAHFCLGAPLARLEARVALELLLPRVAALRRTAEPIQWNMALTTRGPSVLPLEVIPA